MDNNNFILNLENETKNFMNINYIIKKLKKDNFIEKIYSLINDIFINEIKFAKKQILDIKKNIKNDLLIKNLKSNINIYKENIKIIANDTIEILSESLLEKEFINIKNKKNKKFDLYYFKKKSVNKKNEKSHINIKNDLLKKFKTNTINKSKSMIKNKQINNSFNNK